MSMQINVAFVSLFQCTPPAAPQHGDVAVKSDDLSRPTYRGTCIVPFFPNRSTFEDFYGGMEYRLNKYCQAHSSTSSARAGIGAHSISKHEARKRPQGRKVCAVAPSDQQERASTLHPLFSYCCPHCNDAQNRDTIACENAGGVGRGCLRESDVNLSTDEYVGESEISGSVTSYPTITVVALTRRMALTGDVSDEVCLKQRWLNIAERGATMMNPYTEMERLHLPRDANSTLPDETMHLNVFFRCHITHDLSSQCDAVERPLVTKDGMTHRPHSMRDHCPLFISNPQPVEISIRNTDPGAAPHRYRFAQFHTVRDLTLRLERNLGGCVARIWDGETGASIFPCEFLGHVAWKLPGRLRFDMYPFDHLLKCREATGTHPTPRTVVISPGGMSLDRGLTAQHSNLSQDDFSQLQPTPRIRSSIKKRQRSASMPQSEWMDMISCSGRTSVVSDGPNSSSSTYRLGGQRSRWTTGTIQQTRLKRDAQLHVLEGDADDGAESSIRVSSNDDYDASSCNVSLRARSGDNVATPGDEHRFPVTEGSEVGLVAGGFWMDIAEPLSPCPTQQIEYAKATMYDDDEEFDAL